MGAHGLISQALCVREDDVACAWCVLGSPIIHQDIWYMEYASVFFACAQVDLMMANRPKHVKIRMALVSNYNRYLEHYQDNTDGLKAVQ